jgi:signal transduction histidine kinase
MSSTPEAPALQRHGPPTLVPAVVRPKRLGARGRLVLGFSALAVTFAAAFGVQLVRLVRIEHATTELRDHQDEMRLALELDAAARSLYERQDRILDGETGSAGSYAAELDRVMGLVAQLSVRVDEREAVARARQIEAATRGLEETFQRELARAPRPLEHPAAFQHARRALYLQVERNANELFAFLRDATVQQSGAIESLHRANATLALVFAVGAPIAALLIGLSLSRAIARPLAALGEGAARIGRGDLDTRIAIGGSDEFVALASEFNAMAAALQRNQERLLRSEKLAGLGRLAAGIAHEMNNPLQVMLGYLTHHRDRVQGELAEDLGRVEREARRCKEIVETLLQLSRPTPPDPPVPVDLRAVVEEVADAVRVGLPGAPPVRVVGNGTALGNPCRFRQVIFSLARNAVEAAGALGAVEIALSCDAATARVAVSDTGPGIPSELRNRVFEPFFTTKPTGIGLGLALARAIARSQGGDVELDPGEGGGARFVLRAPIAAEGARA